MQQKNPEKKILIEKYFDRKNEVFFRYVKQKYFQTIWKKLQPVKKFLKYNFPELYLSYWKKNMQKKYRHVKIWQKNYGYKKVTYLFAWNKKKGGGKENRARPATELMWLCSPEPGAVWNSLDSPGDPSPGAH